VPESFGPGVSRTLTALAQQFTTVVWQADKPPLDSELNLMSQVDWENLAQVVRSQVHSGFFLDPTQCEADYQTDPMNSNQFILAQPFVDPSGHAETAPVLYANVNGWVVPVAGSLMPVGGGGDSVENRICLYPPPSTDSRTDFVFLEVWRAMVAPNPSTANKPSAGELWKYGNTQYGGTNLVDEIEDPSVGFETTERVQLQYRFRVVGSGDGLGTSVDLKTFPDGLTDPVVLGQGTAASPVAAMTFSNMRRELGDPSLWRAGDGNPANALGTVDGYVYAVPVCAVFRRNTTPFTAISTGGTPNQNGGETRTPSALSSSDATTLLAASLVNDLPETTVGWAQINNYAGSGLGDPNLFPIGTLRRYLVVGTGINREVIAFDLNTDPVGHPDFIFINLLGRGRAGTQARFHPAGTPVALYTTRPDAVYADQITLSDILDMRRGINFGDWDYGRLLQKGVSAIIQNNLRTTFKTSGTGGNTVGPVTTEVSQFLSGAAPTHVATVDATNDIRTVWSDSAALQSEVTVALDNQASLIAATHVTSTTFDDTIAASWSMGADFKPNGFLNCGSGVQGWANGSVIFIDIGGNDGAHGARYGILNAQKAVRFLSPREAWKPGQSGLTYHHPWQLRFIGGVSGNLNNGSPTANPNNDDNAYRAGYITTPATSSNATGVLVGDHPGPMFPLMEENFERPFIVLGGVVNPVLRFTGVPATSTNLVNAPQTEVNIASINWDTTTLTFGREQKSLRDYLTNDGTNFTGLESRLYLVIYGDPVNRDNNGAFQVTGAGTSSAVDGPYTMNVSTDVHHLVVRPMSMDFQSFQNSVTATVTIEFRSQDIYAEDDNGSTNPPQGIAVVLTDLRGEPTYSGGTTTPWWDVGMNYQLKTDGTRLYPITSKATLTMDLLWSPNHGASPRVPDQVYRFGVQSPPVSFVRSPVSVQDPIFQADTSYPNGDVVFDTTHVQLWNRLPSNGLFEPYAPGYGGNVVGLTEQDREAELFVDPGSKTVVIRPFQRKSAIIKGLVIEDAPYGVTPPTTLLGDPNYTLPVFPKDGNNLFETSHTEAYLIPPEFMPRFGRQDIPYHFYTGASDPVYPGINHLFLDQPGSTANVFNIIGGVDLLGGAGVESILFDTTASYAAASTTGGAPHTCYGARKRYLSDVISSDLGTGMWGIELPPYLGIARLYGVYEINDFLAHCDGTNVGAFLNNDRTTLIVGTGGTPPTNILRTDASKQTLFICQNGGNAVAGFETGGTASHTYIVPDSAIDITQVPTYVVGNGFNDFNYVVECVVFGFAEGFISQNCYVLARLHSGIGSVITSTSNLELGAVDMVLPAPPPTVALPYEVYDRTVYQGDPYMTRDGSVVQTADYGARYGQIKQSQAFGLVTSVLPQSVVERPNARAIEVLATMDFYTTLGTGKIGGVMYPNTVIDCGYITPEATSSHGPRIPTSSTDLPWRVLPRTFTQGQNGNQTHARASVQVLDFTKVNTKGLNITVTLPNGSVETYVSTTWGVATSNEDMAQKILADIQSNTRSLFPQANGSVVTLISYVQGGWGNGIQVSLSLTVSDNLMNITTVQSGSSLPGIRANFSGGVDYPVNAGNGDSIVSLTGMTERLPLGILVSDSDFMGENLLWDGATSLRSYPGSLRAVYTDVPLTTNGFEYNRFLGEPGTELSMCDGAILQYVAYTPTSVTGTRKYRIFRGGGAAFMLSGVAPGGPITWVADSFSGSTQPVLKGAALACKALLVRNYHEEAFGVSTIRSEGDEIQMVVLTQAVYGTPTTTVNGVTLSGVISPSGYGQGYAAADRYLLPGRPMDRGRTRVAPDPNTMPAPYYTP
jgi:hypothetical protein